MMWSPVPSKSICKPSAAHLSDGAGNSSGNVRTSSGSKASSNFPRGNRTWNLVHSPNVSAMFVTLQFPGNVMNNAPQGQQQWHGSCPEVRFFVIGATQASDMDTGDDKFQQPFLQCHVLRAARLTHHCIQSCPLCQWMLLVVDKLKCIKVIDCSWGQSSDDLQMHLSSLVSDCVVLLREIDLTVPFCHVSRGTRKTAVLQ